MGRKKRGLGLGCLFLIWLQHQASSQETRFLSYFGGPGPSSWRGGSRPQQTPSRGFQPTSQGSLGVVRGTALPHFLKRSGWIEKQIQFKIAYYMEESKEHPVYMLSSHPTLLGRGCQYLEHRCGLCALLIHVHLGPAMPLVVPDALGHLGGLQPLKSVAVGATPLVDIL